MKKLFYLIATSLSLFFLTPSIANGTVYFVDLNATGTGNGLSWAKAFHHPQDAMEVSLPGDQIWVADGTYTRKSPTDTVVLTMKDGVDIYGGFAGDETDLSERDHETNVTVLDGEKSVRAVIGADNARLDGFTITRGRAPLSDIQDGGMVNNGVSPIIDNCIFSDNFGPAGGMYNEHSSPIIKNSTFTKNIAMEGGGIANHYSSPTITNCTFSWNYADAGGAIANDNSSPTITSCIFTENVADPDISPGGAGIYNSGNSSPTITNCIFIGNYTAISNQHLHLSGFVTISNSYFVGNKYGAIFGGQGTILNSTFAGNQTGDTENVDWFCGAICGSFTITNSTFTENRSLSPFPEGPFKPVIGGPNTIINSIFWRNTGPTGISDNATVTYSNVEGGFPGTGNIDADPLFVDPGHWDDNGSPSEYYDDLWINGDYHLQAGSPSIDSGTTFNAPDEDIEGTFRPQGLGYDMGAYERLFTCTDSDSDGFYEEGGDCGEADCDDDNDAIYPGATETCNGTDDDCDGQIDEGLRSTYYRDTDTDTYGDPTNTTQACTLPSGYVTNNTDCDDTDATVNPAGTEVCTDLKDNDCDGSQDCVDSECSSDIACVDCTDNDGDSYSLEGGVCGPVDCDDGNILINPGATETCNLVDDNCNGSVDEGATTTYYLDSDSDGFGDLSSPTQACLAPTGYVANNSDCDDTDALISPIANEICSDQIDNDCDGQSDCSDSNCSGDPVCTSDGAGDGGGDGGGGCSIVGVNLSISDALAGYGLLIFAGVLWGIRRRRK